MSTVTPRRHKVGELRPSQLLYTFGVGAVVDLPYISAMVMGLDDWDHQHSIEVVEERLLAAVRAELGAPVDRLLAPPAPDPDDETPGRFGAFDASSLIGVPVATFPRWLLCPACRLLSPLGSGLFTPKIDQFRPDRTRYVHGNCSKRPTPPTALPARFLVACERGHLDDFPWVSFVHRGESDCAYRLKLDEFGVSGEAATIQVTCVTCGAKRRMSDAFGESAWEALPSCRGRTPHLRSYDEDPCPEQNRTILLGASNSWFPLVRTALSIPVATNKLAQLVEAHWAVLQKLQNAQNVELLRQLGQLKAFARHNADAIWAAIEAKRGAPVATGEPEDLKVPEWRIFAAPRSEHNTDDFRLRPVSAPAAFGDVLAEVVLAERMREVDALIGFTRIESPGEFGETVKVPEERLGRLSRRLPTWLPASEVKGEGIFIRFDEAAVSAWEREAAPLAHEGRFRDARRRWQRIKGYDAADGGDAGLLRFVLLHSFSHALMRQLAIECGYAVASIRERIYALPHEDEHGPMAGVLLYTAAPDSEGTLGGLVRLGEPERLGPHIAEALERARLCSSDPLCAEHDPDEGEVVTLHGAACHACLFTPETSCERGNRYLDRSVLVDTYGRTDLAFFDGWRRDGSG